MSNNNSKDLSQLKIELLKKELFGNSIKMNKSQKGDEFEKLFRYLIMQPENEGTCLKNLENDIKLFNYVKDNKRHFEVHIIGFAKLSEKENEGSSTAISNKYKQSYEYELEKYEFYKKTKNFIDIIYMMKN